MTWPALSLSPTRANPIGLKGDASKAFVRTTKTHNKNVLRNIKVDQLSIWGKQILAKKAEARKPQIEDEGLPVEYHVHYVRYPDNWSWTDEHGDVHKFKDEQGGVIAALCPLADGTGQCQENGVKMTCFSRDASNVQSHLMRCHYKSVSQRLARYESLSRMRIALMTIKHCRPRLESGHLQESVRKRLQALLVYKQPAETRAGIQ